MHRSDPPFSQIVNTYHITSIPYYILQSNKDICCLVSLQSSFYLLYAASSPALLYVASALALLYVASALALLYVASAIALLYVASAIALLYVLSALLPCCSPIASAKRPIQIIQI